jgi:hypothetical protein
MEGYAMGTRHRGDLVFGLVLILVGAVFLAMQFIPGLRGWFSWPWIIIGAGLLLLFIGVISGVPGMAVPACIVGGIGGLLWWQKTTGNWASWSYAWALIPGFVGAGTILAALLSGRGWRAIGEGSTLIVISLVMFVIFGSFFGAFGGLGEYWPVLLILLGVLVLVRALFRPRLGRRVRNESVDEFGEEV